MIHHVSIGTNDIRPAAECGWRRVTAIHAIVTNPTGFP
jgi:hypothetical protein